LLCAGNACAGGLRWLLKVQKSDATLPRNVEVNPGAGDMEVLPSGFLFYGMILGVSIRTD
jgi:hypothetical protein